MKNVNLDLNTITWAHRIGALESQVLLLFAIHNIDANELPKQLDVLHDQYADDVKKMNVEWEGFVKSIIMEIKERCTVIEKHLSGE